MILERIDSPADLRDLDPDQLDELSQEIRAFIVGAVTTTGGHLGSNLGVVHMGNLLANCLLDSNLVALVASPLDSLGQLAMA